MADGRRKVPRACDRCRKQKLKCDISRPCTLCVRSKATCVATRDCSQSTAVSTPSLDKGRRKRKRDEGRPQSSTGTPNVIQTANVVLETGATVPVLSPAESSDSGGQVRSAQIDSQQYDEEATATNNGNLPSNSNNALPQGKVSPQNPFEGDSSAMGLTMRVFSFNQSQQSSTTSALPGGVPIASTNDIESVALYIQLPPQPVVNALVDSYFDTVHWFMFILHEPSFRDRTRHVLSLGTRIKTTNDADFAALLLMVIALGAQYGGRNPEWRSQSLMIEYSIILGDLVQNCIRQVRGYLLESLEHCQIEAVQTCVLLGTYYIYHGNPNLSWPVLGLAVKTAYALNMHREVEWQGDNGLLQARKRAWGHTYIADTFAAVIYGRPATVDRNFCDVSHPDECDDTDIPMPLGGYLASLNDGAAISRLSYHSSKYQLYDIKAQIISRIYTLRAKASFQAHQDGIEKLVRVVQAFDAKLKTWHNHVPPVFKRSNWKNGDGDPSDIFHDLHETLPDVQEHMKHHFILQTVALQVLYDYILILLHRPLLEYRMSSQKRGKQPAHGNDPFPSSFDICVNAALRISFAPAHMFKYHCPMALMTMHMFTAGVILCIPATMDPFGALAHRTKGGVVRMIRGFKKLSSQTPVVAQSCTILEELMKVVLSRELEMILRPDEQDDEKFSGPEPQQAKPQRNPHPAQSRAPLPSSRDDSMDARQPVTRPDYELGHVQQGDTAVLDYFTGDTGGAAAGISYRSFNDPANSTVSPDGIQGSQSYDFLDAEPDHGFNDAFGALGKVIYDLAPSEWMNPAWMQSYEVTEPFPFSSHVFNEYQNLASMDVSSMSNEYGDAYFGLGSHSRVHLQGDHENLL